MFNTGKPIPVDTSQIYFSRHKQWFEIETGYER